MYNHENLIIKTKLYPKNKLLSFFQVFWLLFFT